MLSDALLEGKTQNSEVLVLGLHSLLSQYQAPTEGGREGGMEEGKRQGGRNNKFHQLWIQLVYIKVQLIKY